VPTKRRSPSRLARSTPASSRSTPFLDGNGRTGRLVLNLLLVCLGIPPAIIYRGDRSRDLAALGSADNGDHGPLGESSHEPCSTTSTRSSSRPSPARAARSAPGTRNRATFRERPTRGGDPRPPEGRQGSRRHMAKLKGVGLRVPRHPLQTLMTRVSGDNWGTQPRRNVTKPGESTIHHRGQKCSICRDKAAVTEQLASACHAEGRGFESDQPLQKPCKSDLFSYRGLSPYHAEGPGFDRRLPISV
jgi:hypothetical protein